ncbi:hypothetical protein BS50DRAFT_495702 [Corynespora cassiicola Philippines]|uniref:Chromosome condensation protein-like protein n=1 Tax=Corynespora cassiicola Philippines TaxID=1448308 RepID=A0A2T2NMP4_CORCC|nr:hypothetical protein BS50DRAFT_495702 [Corynespora cassiicola Philippines]
MADSDDGSLSQRDSHYNQQRSSFPSDRSMRTSSRPHSRRQSSNLISDFILDSSDAPTLPPSPSPAPVIPRRKQSLDKGKRRNSHGSRQDSYQNISPTGSRSRNIDELLLPDWDNLNLDESPDPPPIRDGRGRTFYAPSTLEEERSSRRYQQRRRGTPGTDFDITALPTIPDAPWRKNRNVQAEDYMRTRASPAQRRGSRIATELYTISYLIFFSIFGTLARLGLQWLTFYPGAPSTFSVLWANFSGTLIMGFLAEDQGLFRAGWGTGVPSPVRSPTNDEKALEEQLAAAKASHAKVKKTIPLYIGLATGFCGSFTSFSSFMRDVFFALSNDLPSPTNHPTPGTAASTTSTVARNGGYSFMAVCAVIILTVGLCHAGLKVGAHMAVFLEPWVPAIPLSAARRFVDPLAMFVGWGAWLGAVLMAIWPPDRPGGPEGTASWDGETWRGVAIFGCVFAPVGCLLRFYASVHLNTLVPSFPIGTFAVNIFGTAVLGMAFDLQHVTVGDSGTVGGGRVGCQVLQGLMDGFCGALTTVSTWVLEMDGLRRGQAWIYGSTSVAAGLGILVMVMGSVRWTVGWAAPACAT